MTTNYLQFATESEAKIAAETLRDPAKGLHAKVAENPLFVELVFNAPEAAPVPAWVPTPRHTGKRLQGRTAQGMLKILKLKKRPDPQGPQGYGLTCYTGRPFYGCVATIRKGATEKGKQWSATVGLQGPDFLEGPPYFQRKQFRTLADACSWVHGFGYDMVPSKNLMSGQVIEVTRATYGTASDPGTERYWSM